jgi:hypothetical protein
MPLAWLGPLRIYLYANCLAAEPIFREPRREGTFRSPKLLTSYQLTIPFMQIKEYVQIVLHYHHPNKDLWWALDPDVKEILQS